MSNTLQDGIEWFINYFFMNIVFLSFQVRENNKFSIIIYQMNKRLRSHLSFWFGPTDLYCMSNDSGATRLFWRKHIILFTIFFMEYNWLVRESRVDGCLVWKHSSWSNAIAVCGMRYY